jgi:Class III cytochrome C family
MHVNSGLVGKPKQLFPCVDPGARPMLGMRGGFRSLILMLACLFCIGPSAKAQISPGPLAKAHQSLNGPADCTKCHSVSTKTPSFRCVECHQEIAAELQQHKGLHATYPQTGPPGVACVKCHSDHNGADFSLLHWDPTPKGFDHSKTGYLLAGKHVGVGCRSCHQAAHVGAPWRALLASKDLGSTWLGLSTECVSCHQDQHQGRLGSNCAQCHSTADWKSTKIDAHDFDHSKTRFPLTGLHQRVACEKCHTAGADGQPRYTGLSFAGCSPCHTDPHKGEFQKGCATCHTTVGWKAPTFVSSFDHSKTQFALLGKHLQVPCLTCHKSGDFKTPIAHAQCADCHKPDPHGGQFAKRADGGACESCHTVNGWAPTTFTVADHAKTGFPLVAPHAAVKCASCHVPAAAATRYKIKFALCVDCHEDAHKGQFSGEPWRNRCERCHTGNSFKTSTMTLAKHQQTNFPLTGGHMAVACDDCHKPMGGFTVAVFHFRPLNCTSCHEDVHHGQFATHMTVPNAAGKPSGCEACHSTREWKDLERFDHSRTKFPLAGSHRSVACIDCHRPPNMERSMIHVQFASASTSCSECHENPHSSQFGARGDDCASCHNTNKWRPSLFDHEKTVFSLKGGHQDVACSACHADQKSIDGKLVLFYKPTPTACSACHAENVH